MNLQIENVKQNIIDIINNSGLPIGVINYLFKDISREVANEYNRALSFEQQQKKEQELKEKELKEQKENNDEKESE